MMKMRAPILATALVLVAAALGGCSSPSASVPSAKPTPTQAEQQRAAEEQAKAEYVAAYQSINTDLQESLPIIVDTLANHYEKFFSGDSALLTKAGAAAGRVQACYVRAKKLEAPIEYQTGHTYWLNALAHFDKAMTYFLRGKRSFMSKCVEQIGLGDDDLGKASSAFK